MVRNFQICAVFCYVAGAFALSPPGGSHGGQHQPPAPPGQNHGGEPQGHEWQPAGPFDSRSPCPGLNALANHGWLPRSGRDISYEDIQYAAANAYNFAPDTYHPAFLIANETFKLSTTGSSLTINLRDLTKHDAIEADGSQSRNDIYFGDNLHYDVTVFSKVAADLKLDDYSDNENHVTVQSAAKALAARQVEAKRVNPTFNASATQIQGSFGTTALYLATLWDFDAKAAPKAWVKAFFEEERIAYREGYTAPQVKTLDWVGEMNIAVINATV
ncbi:hypothetical protein LTR15_004987 [Elasticomyces elasticus]|nr:hypothetical protein LTR15_004987 [Elasticomyces elasticus]